MRLKRLRIYSKDNGVVNRLGKRLQGCCQISLESMQQMQSVGLMSTDDIDLIVLDPTTLRPGEAAAIIATLSRVDKKPRYLINIPIEETVSARADREAFVEALRSSGADVTENEQRVAEQVESSLENLNDVI